MLQPAQLRGGLYRHLLVADSRHGKPRPAPCGSTFFADLAPGFPASDHVSLKFEAGGNAANDT